MHVVTATDIETVLDDASLIEALREAFRGDCTAPLRHRHSVPTGDGGAGAMLLKPAWRPGGPFVVKVVNIFPDNVRHGLPSVMGAVLLFDGDTGATLAAIDGGALTVRRTAAASALAADYLAREDAARLLVVGTGQLAPALVRAHAAIRPIEAVEVWGRSGDKADALARSLSSNGMNATPVTALDEAVARADIVTCATLASDPLIRGEWLRPGAHVDLVGSFMPDMREADDVAMRRARIYVDTREGALAEAGELIQAIASGAITPGDVVGEMSELCRGEVAGRASDDEVTLFKSVGTALEDLAAAELIFAQTRAAAT
jgi:ornithine cyclodeaminase